MRACEFDAEVSETEWAGPVQGWQGQEAPIIRQHEALVLKEERLRTRQVVATPKYDGDAWLVSMPGIARRQIDDMRVNPRWPAATHGKPFTAP
jgi:hypothetical protein